MALVHFLTFLFSNIIKPLECRMLSYRKIHSYKPRCEKFSQQHKWYVVCVCSHKGKTFFEKASVQLCTQKCVHLILSLLIHNMLTKQANPLFNLSWKRILISFRTTLSCSQNFSTLIMKGFIDQILKTHGKLFTK